MEKYKGKVLVWVDSNASRIYNLKCKLPFLLPGCIRASIVRIHDVKGDTFFTLYLNDKVRFVIKFLVPMRCNAWDINKRIFYIGSYIIFHIFCTQHLQSHVIIIHHVRI